MKKHCFLKNPVSIVCIMFLLFVSMTAVSYAYPGDDGNAGLTADRAYEIDGQNVLTFFTSDGGEITRTSGNDSSDTQQYTAKANSGWIFSHWLTYYEGNVIKAPNYEFAFSDDWCFSVPGNPEAAYDKYNTTIQVNNEWDATGTYYLYAIFKPVLSVNTDLSNTVSITTIESFESGIGHVSAPVPYGSNVSVQIIIDDNIVERVYMYPSDIEDYEIKDGRLHLKDLIINRPAEISVSTREKIQNVSFEANGGDGNMGDQTFYSGIAQELNANSYTYEGYRFVEWNTKQDGSGTVYSDKESVTFEPSNDGDIITLYAQWEHADHSGGEATCCDKPICGTCGNEYGDLDRNNHVGKMEIRDAKSATATEDGYTGDLYCDGCGNMVAKGKKIPASGMTPDKYETAAMDGSAKTGDHGLMVPWFIALFVSIIGGAVLVVRTDDIIR